MSEKSNKSNERAKETNLKRSTTPWIIANSDMPDIFKQHRVQTSTEQNYFSDLAKE